MNTTRELKLALCEMYTNAAQTLAQIDGVARCALMALESPDVYRNPEAIAKALELITQRCESVLDILGCSAEEAGINATDTGEGRRAAARVAAKEGVNHGEP